PAARATARAPLAARRAGAALLGAYVAAQLLLPLRHHLYPGDVAWTEEGHRFAWRMKLRDKRGAAEFTVIDRAAGRAWSVDPSDRLTSWQYDAVATEPQLLVHYAHELARRWEEYGIPGVQVHARTLVSLNGRDPAPLVDPTIDLAALDHCRPPRCILPLP
ncbi:MAG: HTTM domain-containing protein, partial [Egibacteraceae bacterium]